MSKTITTLTLTILAGTASADIWPHADGMMKHVMVSLENQTIMVHLEGDPSERMSMIRYPGEEYTPPADVLNEKFYNSQYGWMADGFLDLPTGAGIFVQMLSSDPGLEVYEGGMRSMIGMHSFDPILGTDGNNGPWQWGGTMTHNWYAAMAAGDYDTTYEVYVGDAATGQPLDGYTADQVTLLFTTIPAPGTLAVLGLGSIGLLRRRRGGC